MLSLTGKKWEIPQACMEPTEWTQALLSLRDINDESAFLHPSLRSLPDPQTMADMDAATATLTEALHKNEPIVVYGDYDVDGVSATVVLVDFLRRVGANVDYYIPDRREEGYGLNVDAVEQIATRAKLLITVDCGITSYDEIARARELGLRVVVVDHHQVPEKLPPADACIDPQRPDCNFPDKGLCATGVAFMLAASVRRALRASGFFQGKLEPDVRELLDVVAVATVADMVPLRGANRTFVWAGLKQMAAGRRLGLDALLQVSKVSRNKVSATDLGFRIGPRINARGRMSHAAAAVQLLLTDSAAEATTLATSLDRANQQRRAEESRTVEAAMERVGTPGAAIVLYDATWHPGVLGLVASRLVQRFHRPAVIIGEGGKGSARTIPGVNIHTALQSGQDLMEKFGGHPAAAGLTICETNIDALRERVEQSVIEQIGPPPYTATLKPDLQIQPEHLTLETLHALEQLAPFGQANPEPLLFAKNLAVDERRVVGEKHLKLQLQGLDAIAFGMGEFCEALPERVDVAFVAERNEFRGQVRLQIRVEDLRPAA